LTPARVYDPFEIDWFSGRTTGLAFTIWVRAAMKHRRCPRIWVDVDDRLVPVRIRESVRLLVGAVIAERHLGKIRQFVRRNRTVLLEYWACRIRTVELVRRLRPVDAAKPP
jgi:hypothetical protein